jgi:hypothetical protein
MFGSEMASCREIATDQSTVQTNSFLAAFDLADGKELWHTRRTDVPTWSTPTVVKAGDQTQIVFNAPNNSTYYGDSCTSQ